jgi:hemerythrin
MLRYDVPIPNLSLGFMNDDHKEELALIEAAAAALAAGDAEALRAGLAALAVHTRAHFQREEEVMRAVRFPAYPVHKAEHDRVLAELGAETSAYAEAGDAARLLGYLDAMVASWFPTHMATMDTITARFATAAGQW